MLGWRVCCCAYGLAVWLLVRLVGIRVLTVVVGMIVARFVVLIVLTGLLFEEFLFGCLCGWLWLIVSG